MAYYFYVTTNTAVELKIGITRHIPKRMNQIRAECNYYVVFENEAQARQQLETPLKTLLQHRKVEQYGEEYFTGVSAEEVKLCLVRFGWDVKPYSEYQHNTNTPKETQDILVDWNNISCVTNRIPVSCSVSGETIEFDGTWISLRKVVRERYDQSGVDTARNEASAVEHCKHIKKNIFRAWF